jgi:hypothetical protein
MLESFLPIRKGLCAPNDSGSIISISSQVPTWVLHDSRYELG